MGLTDMYKTSHLIAAEYTSFLNTPETFAGLDRRLGNKTRVNKLKIKLISNIFSDYNGMKLEISHRNKTGKCTNMWKLNTLLNNQWSKTKSKGK